MKKILTFLASAIIFYEVYSFIKGVIWISTRNLLLGAGIWGYLGALVSILSLVLWIIFIIKNKAVHKEYQSKTYLKIWKTTLIIFIVQIVVFLVFTAFFFVTRLNHHGISNTMKDVVWGIKIVFSIGIISFLSWAIFIYNKKDNLFDLSN